MQPSKTYLAEDLFEDIPGDPNNIMFKIPPEICESAGWKEGDSVRVSVEDGQMIIKKIDDDDKKISLDKPSELS